MFDLPRAGGNVTFALQFFLSLKIEMYYEGLIQLGNWYLHAGLIKSKARCEDSCFDQYIYTLCIYMWSRTNASDIMSKELFDLHIH